MDTFNDLLHNLANQAITFFDKRNPGSTAFTLGYSSIEQLISADIHAFYKKAQLDEIFPYLAELSPSDALMEMSLLNGQRALLADYIARAYQAYLNGDILI